MSNGLDTLFGPLSKSYCFYFYIFSLLGLISLVLIVVSGLVVGITKRKGLTFYMSIFFFALTYAMIYLQNRLLYNMCGHSL